MENLANIFPTSWINRETICEYIAIGLTALALMLLSLTPYPSHSNFLVLLASAFLLASGNLKKKFMACYHSKAIWSIGLLIAWIAISFAYTHTSLGVAYNNFKDYEKLVFIILLLPLFQNKSKAIHIAELALITGALINAGATLLYRLGMFSPSFMQSLWHDFPGTYPSSFFINSLYVAAITAFVPFIALSRSLTSTKNKTLYLLLFLALSANAIFLNEERSTLLIYTALVLYTVGQRMGIKKCLYAGLFLSTVFIALFFNNNIIHYKATSVINNIKNFSQQSHSAHTSSLKGNSLGIRMQFIKYSWPLIVKKPLTGYGVGSFGEVYLQNAPGKVLSLWHWKGMPELNKYIYKLIYPHNDFLLMQFQFGIIGLGLLLAFFYFALREAKDAAPYNKLMITGLIISYVIFSIAFTTMRQGPITFFPIMFAMYMARLRKIS